MRIVAIGFNRQVNRFRNVIFYVVFGVTVNIALVSCSGNKEEAPVIPPLTSPLSRTIIGFGVVNVSSPYVTAGPEESASLGYLRRGSLARIIERRLVKNGGSTESWVLAEGTAQGSVRGWLREELVDIYDNEGRAKTASELMSR